VSSFVQYLETVKPNIVYKDTTGMTNHMIIFVCLTQKGAVGPQDTEHINSA